MSLASRVALEARTIPVYIVAWTDRETHKIETLAFADENDAYLELDRQRFNYRNDDAVISHDGIDLTEAFPSNEFYVALSKDGKEGIGFFPEKSDCQKYIDEEYPAELGAPKNKKRDFSPLEVRIIA